ncbi:MAG: type II toxin-antitoxin system RelE/ParE family toxin [Thermosynechococcaceae cyanobacterium]
MAYCVEIAPAAKRQIKKLSFDIQKRIVKALEALEQIPRPEGCTKLKGADSLYRIRVGDYRIVYDIQDDVLQVLVVRVGHRRNVYRS